MVQHLLERLVVALVHRLLRDVLVAVVFLAFLFIVCLDLRMGNHLGNHVGTSKAEHFSILAPLTDDARRCLRQPAAVVTQRRYGVAQELVVVDTSIAFLVECFDEKVVAIRIGSHG